MKLAIELNAEEICALGIPLIIEGWDKRTNGRQKRLYHSETTEHERRVIAGFYRTFYKWVLIKGFPETIILLPEQLKIIEKTANIFSQF